MRAMDKKGSSRVPSNKPLQKSFVFTNRVRPACHADPLI